MSCTVPDCHRPYRCKGYCGLHYSRMIRLGTPYLPTPPTFEERFWVKVRKAGADECWVWMAALSSTGYGHIGKDGKILPAHRVSYQLLRSEIPEGLVIDHLCRNRACVNPWHMEPVTLEINTIRGRGWERAAEVTTTSHCPRGHEYTPENTARQGKTRAKVCKKCQRARGNIRNAAHVTPEHLRCGHLSRRSLMCVRPGGHDGKHQASPGERRRFHD